MPDELPLPEWPRPSRETVSSDDTEGRREPDEFQVQVEDDRDSVPLPEWPEPVSTEGRREPDEFRVQVEDAQDSVPLPEWPEPNRGAEASAEVASFDPVPAQEPRESAEFRVQIGEGGGAEIVEVSQQDSQAETLRSIDRHVERLVSLLEDMT